VIAGGLQLQARVSRYRGRLALVVLLVVCIYFLVIFGEQAWRANRLEADLAQQRAAIAAIERENEALATQAALLDADAYAGYVERIARRDLGLARPGDTVLLIPRQQPSTSFAQLETPVPADERSNWQRWLDAFLAQER
jgi:cell division protein FtsB